MYSRIGTHRYRGLYRTPNDLCSRIIYIIDTSGFFAVYEYKYIIVLYGFIECVSYKICVGIIYTGKRAFEKKNPMSSKL